MTLITSKYNYTQLSRESVNGKRLYSCPTGEKVSSVTTILDKTKSEEKKKALMEWRNAIGAERAQQITTEAANRGTRMHSFLEHYVKDGSLKDAGTNPYSQQSRKMAEVIINSAFSNINELWGVEISLYYPGLYAGTTDCVGIWKGQPAIIDFKQTNKPKKKEWIDDYFIQLVAYSLAHNKLYNTEINSGVILMCSQDYNYQEFELTPEEFAFWENEWWNRVTRFYKENG